MSASPKIPDRRLKQLENMAQARAAVGEDSALEAAIPELVTEIFALRGERDRLEAEKRVAVELINGENLTGEYVHKLDEAGLLEHSVHDPPLDTSSTEAVLHLYPLADRIAFVRLAYTDQEQEVAGKAMDYSGGSVRQRWDSGYARGRDVLAAIDRGALEIGAAGLNVHRV